VSGRCVACPAARLSIKLLAPRGLAEPFEVVDRQRQLLLQRLTSQNSMTPAILSVKQPAGDGSSDIP